MTLVTDAPDACRRALAHAWDEADRGAVTWIPAPPGSSGVPDRVVETFLGAGPVTSVPGARLALEPVLVAAEAPESQFARLQTWLAEGAPLPEVLVCVALAGRRFRGQRGRAWATLRGNLHVSVHLTVDVPAGTSQAALSVLPAVAAARAVERASDGRVAPALKWVNDLLVHDRKFGGVLSASHVEAGRVRSLLLGIGLNVAARPELPPTPRALPAACLADVDDRFASDDAWGRVLLPLLEELADARDLVTRGRGAELVDAYRERASFLGRTVTIWPVEEDPDAAPIARGRVEALLPDLSLRIDGVDEPVRRGRMTLEPTS